MELPLPLAWLVDEAGASPGPDRFLAELGGRLLADGLPLAGGALTLAVPHPIIAHRTWLWRAETGAVIEALGFAGGPPNQAGRDWLAGLGPVQEATIGAAPDGPVLGWAGTRPSAPPRPAGCARPRASARRPWPPWPRGRRRDVRLATDDDGLLHRASPRLQWPAPPAAEDARAPGSGGLGARIDRRGPPRQRAAGRQRLSLNFHYRPETVVTAATPLGCFCAIAVIAGAPAASVHGRSPSRPLQRERWNSHSKAHPAREIAHPTLRGCWASSFGGFCLGLKPGAPTALSRITSADSSKTASTIRCGSKKKWPCAEAGPSVTLKEGLRLQASYARAARTAC